MNEQKEISRAENEKLKQRIKVMEEQMERNERKERRNNIVIKGKKFSHREEIRDFIEKNLQIKIEMMEVIEQRNEAINIVRMSRTDKIAVMKNKKRLKETNRKIFIDDDMTRQEREMQIALRIRAKQERARGRNAWVKYGKIVVDGEEWEWDRERREIVNDSKN
jgi:hypothetical protein